MNLAMVQPWCSFGSDGSAYAIEGPLRRGHPHPRNFGTFPRILGEYVRNRHVLRLEEAVRKMTSANASKIGLLDRGLLRPGQFADVTLFEPEVVIDRATYLEPFHYPEGIAFVVVNGQVVLEKGRHTDALPGRAPSSIDQTPLIPRHSRRIALRREHAASERSPLPFSDGMADQAMDHVSQPDRKHHRGQLTQRGVKIPDEAEGEHRQEQDERGNNNDEHDRRRDEERDHLVESVHPPGLPRPASDPENRPRQGHDRQDGQRNPQRRCHPHDHRAARDQGNHEHQGIQAERES